MSQILFSSAEIKSLPGLPGVYIFKDQKHHILYVGKAKSLKERLVSYLHPESLKTQEMAELAKFLEIIPVDNEIDALILEANLIKKYLPKYNVNFKDGKSYPFVKITWQDDYPKVYAVHRGLDNDGNLYFGPYPTGADLRFILRYLRRIFPFCTHRQPYQSCLYYHLGLCPGPEFGVNKKAYRKNIRKIVLFLSGKRSQVLQNLDREIARAVQEQNFEKAQVWQKQKEKILQFHSFRQEPNDYLNDSETLKKLRNSELKELTNLLQKENIINKSINSIEGYDIANISGREATASLVRFDNGEPNKKLYRHFKIKTHGPNDVAMLRETIKRRFSHPEWAYPDLLLIDGGFGQLNAVTKALSELKINVPAVSLAKKEEHLCLPNGREIALPRESNALHLLQRIRDESHRFARRYHHLLRSRMLVS